MHRFIDDTWLWLKRLVVKSAAWIFALATFLLFGVVVVQLGAGALAWLKTGIWGSAKTISEVVPDLANYVAAMQWIGVQRIALWLISQSMIWAYFVMGVISFCVFGVLSEAADDLEALWQGRPSRIHGIDAAP